MKACYSTDSIIDGVPQPSIFLAGPTARDERITLWRLRALELLAVDRAAQRTYALIPEPGPGLPWPSNQIEREQQWLGMTTVIMFWIPRSLEMPGFTTNIEWGWAKTMRRTSIVLGYPKGTEKMGYIDYDARRLNIPVFHTLEETCSAAASLCERIAATW